MDLKVVIIGAGVGGLCLAQQLVGAGIHAEVFERDPAAQARRQGYRLHLDADGVGALRQSLPDPLFALFEATSMVPLRYTTIMDTDFSIRRRFITDEYSKTTHHLAAGIATHLNVNRATLREILLLGLQDRVHFGKRLSHYTQDNGQVRACFDDGSSVQGDILVGADGANSMVRAQRLPDAPWMDSGARSIYGRLSIDVAREFLPALALGDVFSAVSDSRKLIFGVGPVVFPSAPDRAARQLSADFSLSPQQDYVGCIVAGRKELFGEDPQNRALPSEGLQGLAAQLVAPWPCAARAAIEHAQPGSFFFIEMSSSVPAPVPPPAHVTLLGDAIHAMTPSLGRGANVALRDAAMLAQSLRAVQAGQQDIPTALAGYEREMLARGFSVVRHSAEMGARLLGQDPLPEHTRSQT